MDEWVEGKWIKAPKTLVCSGSAAGCCGGTINKNEWAWEFRKGGFWCKKVTLLPMKGSHSKEKVWEFYKIPKPPEDKGFGKYLEEEKRISEELAKEQESYKMLPFEQLSQRDKAVALSKRFNKPLQECQTLAIDKMVEVWKAGKWDMPTSGNGKSLADLIANAMKGQSLLDEPRVRVIANEEITSREGGIIKKALDKITPELQEIKDLVLSNREVKLELPSGEMKKLGKQHFKYEDVFKLVSLKLNVWMGGPAGAGKTYLASEIARALDWDFYRISCGPQTAASQIFGHTTAHGGYAQGIAYQALKNEKGAILLFDEFDRLNPAVGVMVNGLLDGNAVTFPNGETLKQSEKCIFLVAANTFGKPNAEFGTAQRQDTATMSRFVKVAVPVDEKLEMAIFGAINEDWVKFVQKVRGVVSRLGVTSLCVTPRASEYGVKMLASGMKQSNVEELLLWNGLPTEDVKKIKANL